MAGTRLIRAHGISPGKAHRFAPGNPTRQTGDLPTTKGVHVFEYKVLTERDSKFSGKFDSESLEEMLNGYAGSGWRVVSGFLATSVWKSSKTDIVVILERDKSTTD